MIVWWENPSGFPTDFVRLPYVLEVLNFGILIFILGGFIFVFVFLPDIFVLHALYCVSLYKQAHFSFSKILPFFEICLECLTPCFSK